MNCTICNGSVKSMTSVLGKKRYGVTQYRWCPKDDRIFAIVLDDKGDFRFLRLLL